MTQSQPLWKVLRIKKNGKKAVIEEDLPFYSFNAQCALRLAAYQPQSNGWSLFNNATMWIRSGLFHGAAHITPLKKLQVGISFQCGINVHIVHCPSILRKNIKDHPKQLYRFETLHKHIEPSKKSELKKTLEQYNAHNQTRFVLDDLDFTLKPLSFSTEITFYETRTDQAYQIYSGSSTDPNRRAYPSDSWDLNDHADEWIARGKLNQFLFQYNIQIGR